MTFLPEDVFRYLPVLRFRVDLALDQEEPDDL